MIDKLNDHQDVIADKLKNIDSLDESDREWLDAVKREVDMIDGKAFNLKVNKNAKVLDKMMNDLSEALEKSSDIVDMPLEKINYLEIDPIVQISNGLEFQRKSKEKILAHLFKKLQN